MSAETLLDEPLIRRIFFRVLDRLDNQPAAERSRRIRINLDPQTAPEIHHASSLADRAVAWAAVENVVTVGWGHLGYRLHRRYGAPEEREPYISIEWPCEIEDLIRDRLKRPRKELSYSRRWRDLVDAAN